MKSTYKRLGDYIEEIEERNRDLSVKLSQGICNLKYFQNPRQVAENSAADKIVRRGWFAYNRATTRNGDKISIAYRDGEDCTVSASYLTFRIKDENLLNPYYLMMWFKRPEFDRYARFKSHGSAHEYFEWDEMCDVMLPVPSIEEQRKIVAEYQAVERRIENNRHLIATLESTAQTIYRQMFVDNIDPENLPQDWRMGKMKDVATFAYGKIPKDKDNGVIPVFSGYGVVGYCNEAMYDKQHIVVIARGDSGSGKI
ncbi:restriction endonuclease subunit S, partial [uncultured Duncaniella sp.]